jgi:predicted dehydrogenase
MEAFVDAVKGRNPPCWVTSEDSIAQMETIDAIYQAANLPVRPSNILEKSE